VLAGGGRVRVVRLRSPAGLDVKDILHNLHFHAGQHDGLGGGPDRIADKSQ